MREYNPMLSVLLILPTNNVSFHFISSSISLSAQNNLSRVLTKEKRFRNTALPFITRYRGEMSSSQKQVAVADATLSPARPTTAATATFGTPSPVGKQLVYKRPESAQQYPPPFLLASSSKPGESATAKKHYAWDLGNVVKKSKNNDYCYNVEEKMPGLPEQFSPRSSRVVQSSSTADFDTLRFMKTVALDVRRVVSQMASKK